MSPFCGAVLDDTVEDDEADERRKLLAISFFNRLIPDELDEARSCPLLEAGTPFSTKLAPLLEILLFSFIKSIEYVYLKSPLNVNITSV